MTSSGCSLPLPRSSLFIELALATAPAPSLPDGLLPTTQQVSIQGQAPVIAGPPLLPPALDRTLANASPSRIGSPNFAQSPASGSDVDRNNCAVCWVCFNIHRACICTCAFLLHVRTISIPAYIPVPPAHL